LVRSGRGASARATTDDDDDDDDDDARALGSTRVMVRLRAFALFTRAHQRLASRQATKTGVRLVLESAFKDAFDG
jgi:hypothetical protein